MTKQIYRKAMASIVPSDILLRKTAVRMQNVQADRRKRVMRLKRYSLSGSALLAVCAFVVLMTGEQLRHDDTPLSTGTPSVIIQPSIEGGNEEAAIDSSTVMDKIKSYFVPFQASEYVPVRAPFPIFPLEYEELKQESSAIVKVTIKDVGVYRDKEVAYNPRASFGTYIYVTEVESVLHGTGIKEETLIPITELAWAMPGEQVDEPEWSFKPYTARPLQELKSGEQYVLFLGKKDGKETYPLIGNGFGAFSLEEMKREASSYTLDQLREMHQVNMEETSTPMLNNLVYRLFALETYHEFKAELNK
ncbi:hypothetical protein ACF3MZ_18855 [Paenibacillaceae bacterium WGS1546]|uniref:hypothetical protein n=1 Tax=Cohnella sp. WGS1546 TaxID=3366810 RepID=UPI00372D7AEF